MYVVCVDVFVKAGHEQDFIAATEQNHRGSLQESGALRFDVLQGLEDPTRFFLYEVYRDAAALDAHKQTEHYQTWRDTVAAWMARPRQGTKYHRRFPADGEG